MYYVRKIVDRLIQEAPFLTYFVTAPLGAFIVTKFLHISAWWLVVLAPLFWIVIVCYTNMEDYGYAVSVMGVLKCSIALVLSTLFAWYSGDFFHKHLLSKGWSIFIGILIWLFALVILNLFLLGVRLCAYCKRPTFSLLFDKTVGKPDCKSCGGLGYFTERRGSPRYPLYVEVPCGCAVMCSKCRQDKDKIISEN